MTILSDYCRDSACPYCDLDICLRIIISNMSNTIVSTAYSGPTSKGYSAYSGIGDRWNGTYDIAIPLDGSGCGYTCPTLANRTITLTSTITKTNTGDTQNDCSGSLGTPTADSNEGSSIFVVDCVSTGDNPYFYIDAEVKTPLDDDFYVRFSLTNAWIHFPLCTPGCRFVDIPRANYTGILQSPFRTETFDVSLEYVEC